MHRREIFDRVWTDVIVLDSALSQAVRTIRRTLGDDSREPRFISTVSRHGYRFVFPDVVEEEDDGARPAAPPASRALAAETPADGFEPLPDFGPVSRAILAFGEGALFGLGLAYGLMRRPLPASPESHAMLTPR